MHPLSSATLINFSRIVDSLQGLVIVVAMPVGGPVDMEAGRINQGHDEISAADRMGIEEAVEEEEDFIKIRDFENGNETIKNFIGFLFTFNTGVIIL